MKTKVEGMLAKLPEVEAKMGDPDVVSDQKAYQELASEHKYLSKLKEKWDRLTAVDASIADDQEFLKTETDKEMRDEIEQEVIDLKAEKETLLKEVEVAVIPPDPDDNKNTIVEMRAGTGGDEAAIFVGDCARMYRHYAESQGWSFELLSYTDSDAGGFKDYQFALSGEGVYRFMKYEGGTHRVQRIPKTETQGRVHTSAITIAVLIEPDEDEEINIEEKDLRVDTYRASGAGGQHVNTTDSAVRVTHIPTGLVSYCSEERSQIKNRAKAMRLLRAKIADQQRIEKEKEIASARASQVGSGDRSERIRTYNFPQNRLTDHRIDLTLFSLSEIMEGDLDQVIGPLVAYYYQKRLEFDEVKS
jgi:peptide chain release factor 1